MTDETRVVGNEAMESAGKEPVAKAHRSPQDHTQRRQDDPCVKVALPGNTAALCAESEED